MLNLLFELFNSTSNNQYSSGVEHTIVIIRMLWSAGHLNTVCNHPLQAYYSSLVHFLTKSFVHPDQKVAIQRRAENIGISEAA